MCLSGGFLVKAARVTALICMANSFGFAGVTFQPPVSYSVGQGPVSIAVADFNGDGIADLAVANYTANTVSILLGSGKGTFRPQVSYATNTGPTTVVAADFNGDGKGDLAVYNIQFPGSGGNIDYISVLIGKGDGTFQPRVDYSYGTSLGEGSLTVGDFNGDGKLDMAAANSGHATGEVEIFLGNGDGTFQGFQEYSAKGGQTAS
jgi:FG-GAP-like repeat